jgi:endo-1,4-beta-mannosidase
VSAKRPSRDSGQFRLGINYWPARTAMGWWSAFERSEVAEDFSRIAASGFDSVRLFLSWEDFQPTPDSVDLQMIARLVECLEISKNSGLSLMPTLFTGHMSGVNWIPPWALGGEGRGDARFRVVSNRSLVAPRLLNWYTDEAVLLAQISLASTVARALAGHDALWAWDLGNENSNCVVPPSRVEARNWLMRVSDAIRNADADALVTVGLHMEDLEQDRQLGPAEAAEACDFLQMHGYPGYAAWARGPTDEALLPFLARVTRWLGGGVEVLFAEFGVPTYRRGDPEGERVRRTSQVELVEEEEAASYIERALAALLESGSTGALLWCHSDYVPGIWQKPPLDRAVHERSFGIWRADGSPKPALAALEKFAKLKAAPRTHESGPTEGGAWIDIDQREFYRAPSGHLPRLYRRYCQANAKAPRFSP